jgi:hypothetical protein
MFPLPPMMVGSLQGSVKDGASRDPKYDYGEDEELHVLITGDTQDDVDAAAVMIEELLQPMDEVPGMEVTASWCCMLIQHVCLERITGQCSQVVHCSQVDFCSEVVHCSQVDFCSEVSFCSEVVHCSQVDFCSEEQLCMVWGHPQLSLLSVWLVVSVKQRMRMLPLRTQHG